LREGFEGFAGMQKNMMDESTLEAEEGLESPLIENPEIHLHPGAKYRLGSLFAFLTAAV